MVWEPFEAHLLQYILHWPKLRLTDAPKCKCVMKCGLMVCEGRQGKQMPENTRMVCYSQPFWLPNFFSFSFPPIEHINYLPLQKVESSQKPRLVVASLSVRRDIVLFIRSSCGSTWLCALWSNKTSHPSPTPPPLRIHWHHLAIQSLFYL